MAMARCWRESASLIVLSKFRAKCNTNAKNCDYKVLLLKRPSKASFMANSYVFPGGVNENTDESSLWLKHFNSFGVPQKKFETMGHSMPNVFKAATSGALEKDISLRITAIRETFEEVGILLGRSSLPDMNNGYGSVTTNLSEEDRVVWQQKVHKDSLQFQTLCEHLKIMPDLWNLNRWSTWLTPSSKPKRFATAFYVVALEEMPQLLAEKNEVAEYAWKTPLEYLLAYKRKELDLPPPQFYELSRLVNMNNLDDVLTYSRQRLSKNTSCMLPVQYQCSNGIVGLLPGDEMYPTDPNASDKRIPINKSVEEFRAESKKLHRYEYEKFRDGVLQLNFQLEGELNPMNV